MWTRSELKNNAKSNLRINYWPGLVVFLIYIGIATGAGIVSSCIPFAALIVLPIIMVGVYQWYLRSRSPSITPGYETVFAMFKNGNFGPTLGSMLWFFLFIFIWGLFYFVPFIITYVMIFAGILVSMPKQVHFESDFNSAFFSTDLANAFFVAAIIFAILALIGIIPLAIKAYSYRLTPWILADNPRIGAKRALKLSIELTRGQKWKMFVLDLSFVGWGILGFLCCFIGILFLAPYYFATQAELYAALRQNGVDSGLCTMEELGYIKAN